MNLEAFQGQSPSLGDNHYISSGCHLIGDVRVGEDASIWFGSVLRGDINYVSIGKETNIQDLSLLHVTTNDPVIIGDYVTVGHRVILHGCTIGNNSLVGMGAICMDGVEVGESCLIAAGSVLTPNKKFPPGVLIMGSPAKVVRDLTPQEKELYENHYKKYLNLKNKYLKESKLE